MSTPDRDLLFLFKLRVGAIIMEMSEAVAAEGESVDDFLTHIGAEVLVLAAHVHREYGGTDNSFIEMARVSLALARTEPEVGETIQ
jgi:hypothetical protein